MRVVATRIMRGFQHTAARRRLAELGGSTSLDDSTHSRPKAAGTAITNIRINRRFQHTAARRRLNLRQEIRSETVVSTHSRPKAAGFSDFACLQRARFQHTAARRRLIKPRPKLLPINVFQHTAARRRLPPNRFAFRRNGVSTHSRPKAAGPTRPPR